MKPRVKQKAFTIVELLIVIVVIGILAAITIVAYNGVQARSRDNVRKSDLSQIAKSLHLYNIDEDNYLSATGGCSSGGGWFHNDYDGTGPLKSMRQCLADKNLLSTTINDPQYSLGCTVVVASPLQENCFYYMKYDCGGIAYLFANLESLPHSTTDTDSFTCQPTLDSRYGMNYVLRVN